PAGARGVRDELPGAGCAASPVVVGSDDRPEPQPDPGGLLARRLHRARDRDHRAEPALLRPPDRAADRPVQLGPQLRGPVTGPLAGLRVVDASSIIAGPLCCQILADYGADVVKVEHPRDGDPVRGHGAVVEGTSLWWKVLGRNKRTVGIDLHTEAGQGLFRELGARADVVVESFRPGVLDRWGIGPDRLREDNPGLVILHVTGFGQTGPYASRA